MTKHYYLDTNALVKYSYYQDYKSEPEYGVEDIRELINNKKGIFYLSHLTLWEFHNVLLKTYRTNEKWMVFGATASERQSKLMRTFFEIKQEIESEKFVMENSAITAEIFIKSDRLMLKYIGGQRIKLDSIDALHIAFIQFLIKKYNTNIIIVTADETMMETCQSEGIEVLFIQKPLANTTT